MNFTKRLLITLIVIGATIGIAAAANPPGTINYQGVLRDTAGNPDNGLHDMVFRFFSSNVAGVEIAVVWHTSTYGTDVTAVNGLFNVAIGSGPVTDGTGPGTYTTLSSMFGNYEDVFMQVEIDGEVLSPRVRVLATPYAHNASEVGGLEASQLLRNDISQTINGSLTAAGSLSAESYLRVNSDGPEGNGSIYFYENGSSLGEAIQWLDTEDKFRISDDLQIVGDLELDRARTGYTANSFSLVADYSTPAYFGTRFEAASLSTYMRLDPYYEIELVGQSGVEIFDVDVNGAALLAADFESQDIRFYIEGSTAAFISNAENFSVYGSNLLIGRNGPDRDQDLEFYEGGAIEGERLQWDDSEDRFEFSDDFFVFGDSGASGVKNFVQNHPEDPTLEIVYTSLEGNEATTFTRGTARLKSGVATILLEDSFAMVTNPDLGLSVHLTPRGQFAQLYAASVSTSELVVHGEGGEDVVFDYIVYGLRVGFEDFPVFRRKMAESPIPPAGHHDAHYAERPELRRHSALARYRQIEESVHGRVLDDMPRARALRTAIGERAPGFDVGAGETIPQVNRPDELTDGQEAPAVAELPQVAAGKPDLDTAPHERGETPGQAAPATSTAPEDVRARSFRPSASDLASMHASVQPLQPGDVVVLSAAGDGRVELATFAAEPTVFGVVASDPGIVLGKEDDAAVAIATSGVVPCKVDAGYGPVRPGDLLVTSPTPGHAMRAGDPAQGTVLGKAVGALDQGTGTIQVIVTLR